MVGSIGNNRAREVFFFEIAFQVEKLNQALYSLEMQREIPNDILLVIFGMIPKRSQFSILLTCKRWLLVGKEFFKVNYLPKVIPMDFPLLCHAWNSDCSRVAIVGTDRDYF